MNTYQPRAFTRPVRMSQAERIGHAVLVILTLGLWLPVYWKRLRSFRGRTVTEWK